MGHRVLAVLILIFGFGAVLMHNHFSFAQMSPSDWIAAVVCLIAALILFFWKKGGKQSESNEIHTMTFSLEGISCDAKGNAPAAQGQQLYLKPYEGTDSEQIAVTDETMQILGFVPEEYREYVLSRIEGHRLTHTVAEQVEKTSLGSYRISVRITC